MSSPSDEESSVRLRPYVPRLVVDWLREQPDDLYQEIEGSLAFVDISGFTTLTERLARRGKVGAEEMSDALNSTFAALLAEAYEEGAGLVKWGGDAVLLLFDGAEHASRACRAAHRMRATMRQVGRLETSVGRVTLRMSVGIHSGTFHFFLVGDPDHHRELIVSGPAASRTAEMEAQANAGEIVISAQTAALLEPRVVGEASGEGFKLRSVPDAPVVGIQPAKDVRDLDLRRVIPEGIRQHLLADPGEAEHRTIAVAFVQFSGTDALLEQAGPAALADALDTALRNVQDATSANGVTFFETDINRDGGKIMLTAGAPRSLGHDEERMLRAARLVVERIGELPLRIGVNRGPVFSGDFGPEFRKTYSVKGDAVNLAARVMGKAAPGQLLATRAVVERSRTVFETEELPPFTVKGKSEVVEASSIGLRAGARVTGHADLPLVGREAEMAVLVGALDDARQRRGRLVELVGEPGIGKSRLVEELQREATDATVLLAGCEEYESSTAYFPFRRLLREVLGIPAAAPADQVLERLVHRVEANAPELLPWLPLVGVPLDVAIPETAKTARLDERFRKSRVEEVTAAVLALALPTTTLLVFDDVHLMDEASTELLSRIVARVADLPWFVLTTRREELGGFHAGPGQAIEVRPGPLDAAAALAMIGAQTAAAPLPPHELAILTKRAGGNPLFLQGLIEAAVGSGSVDGLPDSVEDLITSQIDRLPPSERTVLRYASVLGVTFTEGQLRAMLHGEPIGVDEQTVRRLSRFLHAEGHGRFRFTHELVRSTAYEGLPFQRRKALHGRVGETMEAGARDPADQSELLSLHFFEAGRLDKAWHYSRIAGDRAVAKNAFVEASEHLGRAVAAARGLPSLDRGDLSRVQEALGDARFRVGVFEDAATAFRRARLDVEDDPVRTADLLRKQAEVHQRLNRLPQALRTLSRAMRVIEDRHEATAQAERSRLEGFYAVVRRNQGRYREAVSWGRRAESTAATAGDRRALADAYESLHSAYAYLGVEPGRPYGDLALELYVELEDRASQSIALNNLAINAYLEGRGPEALELFRRAEAAAAEAGDTLGAAASRFNIGDVLLHQGRLEEARVLLQALVPVLRSLGSEDFVAAAQGSLGLVLVELGAIEEGRTLLAEARATLVGLGQAAEVVSTDALSAAALLAAGDATGTEALAARAWSSAAELDAGYLQPTLQRLQGAALLDQGRLDDAELVLESALVSCQQHGQIERGFILAELARVAVARGDEVTSRALAALSREALDVLGYAGTTRYPRTD